MRKLNVGIVGMGYIGESHIEAVRRIGSCNLYAVADANRELAKAKAELYGIEKCCSYVDELINDPKVDAIHNCTPNFLHTEINQKIIESGKHLFSEKPLSKTYEEARSLIGYEGENSKRRNRRRAYHKRELFAGLAFIRHRLQLAPGTGDCRKFLLYCRHRIPSYGFGAACNRA